MREISWDDYDDDDEQDDSCNSCDYNPCICDYVTDVLTERELDCD